MYFKRVKYLWLGWREPKHYTYTPHRIDDDDDDESSESVLWSSTAHVFTNIFITHPIAIKCTHSTQPLRTRYHSISLSRSHSAVLPPRALFLTISLCRTFHFQHDSTPSHRLFCSLLSGQTPPPLCSTMLTWKVSYTTINNIKCEYKNV